MREELRRLSRNALVQHLVFWVVAFLVLLRIFAEHEMWNKTDVVYTCLFILSIIGGVYLNLKFLIPQVLNRKKWPIYLLSIILVLILSIPFNELIFEVLSDWIFPGYYFISYYTYFEIGQFILAFLLLTTLLKLSKSWFGLQEAQAKMLKLEGLQRRTELDALRAQVNPHFLFNSLHSIYSLSLSSDSTTPQVILKLSAVLRYMLYESNTELVVLEREIDCIKNYFDLQKMRLDESARIQLSVKGSADQLEIAPLLMMPLVENSFKHSLQEDAASTYITGSISIEGGTLEFRLENSVGAQDQRPAHSGIGLDNLKRRLDLIYPGKHHFGYKRDEAKFVVDLKIVLR